MLEQPHSAQILMDLSRSNALLAPLDPSDEDYRYHVLFAEMLRGELRPVPRLEAVRRIGAL